MKQKVITFAGTRPELIRLSVLLKKLDETFDHIFVYTGQNFTDELSTIFFRDLEIRKPDYHFNFAFTSLSEFLSQLYLEAGVIVEKEQPDVAVLLGDTNTGLVTILLERMGVSVFHIEAGNRCFNDNTPEELNRRVIDKASSYNLVYSEYARRNLLNEGFLNENIFKIGSPMREVLSNYAEKIERSSALSDNRLVSKKYFLTSLHRQENIDDNSTRTQLLTALNLVAEEYELPIIVSSHPRLKDALSESKDFHKLIRLAQPFGFFDWCKLQKEALLTISDSGSISEEASILRFKAVTPRVTIERQEAIEAGTIIRCNPTLRAVQESVRYAICHDTMLRSAIPEDYMINNTSDRVISTIINHRL